MRDQMEGYIFKVFISLSRLFKYRCSQLFFTDSVKLLCNTSTSFSKISITNTPFSSKKLPTDLINVASDDFEELGSFDTKVKEYISSYLNKFVENLDKIITRKNADISIQ